MRWSLSLAFLLCSLTPQTFAFRGALEDSRSEARRFGLDRPEPASPRTGSPDARALARFNTLRSKGASIRTSPSGTISSIAGPLSEARGGSAQEIAAAFLVANHELLRIDPDELELERSNTMAGGSHLLYRQRHKGVPVEFSRVKIHLSERGEVLGFQSSYVPGIDLPAVPTLSAQQAARAASADGGGGAEGGSLVYLPLYKNGELRLAWKFKTHGARRLWVYYVDAHSGEILFRYDELRYACPSGTSGTVTGEVFDIDPTSTPVQVRPIPHQKVYMYNAAMSTYAVTGLDGSFCNTGTSGKIFTSLQGPYARVAHFQKGSMLYDNGGGSWFSAASPVSTPHPYPNGAAPNSSVFVGTPAVAAPPTPQFPPGSIAVRMLPHFSSFAVGSLSSVDGEILDDDQAQILDADGEAVASYVGNRSAFVAAGVQGCLACDQAAGKPPLRVLLRASASGQQQGFDIDVSSFMVLTNAPTVAANPSNVFWAGAGSADGTRDEINVFYHLNAMHDYFINGVNRSSAAAISVPVAAMVHFGPNLANAFFNPEQGNFAFGDVGGGIALDATVIRHEYTHFVIDKIYPIINFGQFGAISEALADYFAGSSLNNPSIGKYVSGSFGSETSLRELACAPLGGGTCAKFPQNWNGQIHADSLPLSQAFWEIRNAKGAACADGLVFQSLFYYPESFQEFYDALIAADHLNLVAECGGSGAAKTAIQTAFAAHFSFTLADAFEPNDGGQSATDISTRPSVSAAISPAGDTDYYTFGAGPGSIRAVLSLPRATSVSYYAYSLSLIDRQLNVLAQADPVVDINPTGGGLCPNSDCQTSQSQVVLSYANPAAGKFFLRVSAAPTDGGSNSGTQSTVPYGLAVDWPRSGAVSGEVVSAVYDQDNIQFSVAVTSFSAFQDYSFAYAQLRDQSMNVLPQTQTNGASPYLNVVGLPSSSGGRITGTVSLSPGFAARFPSVGTIHLEIFGKNRLQAAGAAQAADSLGLSQALTLAGSGSPGLTAWNNIFNPNQGQKATFKYETSSAGRVRLKLYTMGGTLVSTILDADMPAGKGSVDWAGKNMAGSVVASGVYLLHLEGPGVDAVEKVIVVK